MSRILLGLRALLHGDDATRAVRAERAVYEREAARGGQLREKLRAAYSTSGAEACLLGHEREHGWPVSVSTKQLGAHSMLIGPSGCGKSRFVTLIARSLLRAGVRRLFLADPKSETCALFKAAIVDLGRSLSSEGRCELYSRVIDLSLSSKHALPRLNVLAPIEGLDPELHAFEVTTLLTADLDQACGLRQESLLYRVIECLIRARLPLTALPIALETPLLLDRLSEQVAPADLFKTTAERLRKEPKDRVLGLVSRAERVLRLKATRLALGGSETCLDFGALLGYLTLFDLASQGGADITKVIAGILWMNLSHAIRRLPNGAPRAHVVIDEFPTFLAGGGARMADGVEDLLRLARSKGVFLTALSQDLVSIAKISSSLPEVMRGNVHLFGVFRAVSDSGWDFMLPVTGERRWPAGAPWETAKGGYLERGAETALLRRTLSCLPDRELFFVDRRSGLPGIRMRTADLALDAREDEMAELEETARRHPMLASVPELERGEGKVKARIQALLEGAHRGTGETAADNTLALRRARRRLEIG